MAKTSYEAAHTYIALRQSNLDLIARLQAAGKIRRPIRKHCRLNFDSAIRRVLVGAKGLRP